MKSKAIHVKKTLTKNNDIKIDLSYSSEFKSLKNIFNGISNYGYISILNAPNSIIDLSNMFINCNSYNQKKHWYHWIYVSVQHPYRNPL